jgi:carbonic anhydrase
MAVVSMFFQVDDNEENNEVLKAFKIDQPGTISVNMANTFKGQLNDPIVYFSYKGSRTIPPCNEDINWYVIEKPLAMTTG